MKQQMLLTEGKNGRRVGLLLLILAVYLLLAAGYISMRYGWQALGGDANSLTRLSQNVLIEGTITPEMGAYPFGYLYPTLNTFLAQLTGVPVQSLQMFVQPFLIVLLVPIGFAAFRSLTGSSIVALLASLLLFLQAEFLFEAMRSSHAKVTWILALVMLFVLARSFQTGKNGRQLFAWVIVFYLIAFGLVTSSSFFASNYIFGLAFAFVGTLVLLSLPRTKELITPQMRRLSYVTLSSLILVVLFIFFLYAPAMTQISILQSVFDKVAVFFLDVEVTAESSPYNYVQATWINTPTFLVLTSLSWLILLLSFSVWLYRGWQLLVRRESVQAGALLLWMLYAGFVILLAIGVITDFSGALSRNLQLRIFPHLMVVAIPLAAEAIVAAVRWSRGKGVRTGRLVSAMLLAAIAFFALSSMLKVTNEPLLSNYWSFYGESEKVAVGWVDEHVRSNEVWIGADTRLRTLAATFGSWSEQKVYPERGTEPVVARYLLMSDIMRKHAGRSGYTLPDNWPYQKVFDAGDAELYYSLPQTPFQR